MSFLRKTSVQHGEHHRTASCWQSINTGLSSSLIRGDRGSGFVFLKSVYGEWEETGHSLNAQWQAPKVAGCILCIAIGNWLKASTTWVTKCSEQRATCRMQFSSEGYRCRSATWSKWEAMWLFGNNTAAALLLSWLIWDLWFQALLWRTLGNCHVHTKLSSCF